MTLVIIFLKVSVLCFVVLRILKITSVETKVLTFANKNLHRRVSQVFVPVFI